MLYSGGETEGSKCRRTQATAQTSADRRTRAQTDTLTALLPIFCFKAGWARPGQGGKAKAGAGREQGAGAHDTRTRSRTRCRAGRMSRVRCGCSTSTRGTASHLSVVTRVRWCLEFTKTETCLRRGRPTRIQRERKRAKRQRKGNHPHSSIQTTSCGAWSRAHEHSAQHTRCAQAGVQICSPWALGSGGAHARQHARR